MLLWERGYLGSGIPELMQKVISINYRQVERLRREEMLLWEERTPGIPEDP
jgi:hypothetical protein